MNAKHEHIRFKWGVGRMVYDCWKGSSYLPNGTDSSPSQTGSNPKNSESSYPIKSQNSSQVLESHIPVGTNVTTDDSCRSISRVPVVLPLYHCGMDSVLPNKYPYIPQIGQRVTIVVGEPIYLESLIDIIKKQNLDRVAARRIITDRIQEEMSKLREQAEKLHRSHIDS